MTADWPYQSGLLEAQTAKKKKKILGWEIHLSHPPPAYAAVVQFSDLSQEAGTSPAARAISGAFVFPSCAPVRNRRVTHDLNAQLKLVWDSSDPSQ